MNSFSNNFERSELHSNYTSSLINILYYSTVHFNKNCIFKNNNDVIVSYKDTVVNKTVYVSSSGLKRNSVFKSEEFDKILAKKELTTFVSYFKILEDDRFQFKLYPEPYKKVLVHAFIKKESAIHVINTTSLVIKTFPFRSKYTNKHKYKFLTQKFLYNGSFDKKIIVKLYYRHISLATTRGILFPRLEPNQYNLYRIMSGLLFILKKDMKINFGKIIISNYRLLRFFTKNFQNPKNNINILTNIILYYYFAKFLFKDFFNKRDLLKLKWRKTNKYIFKYFLRRHKKIFKFVNLFFKLILHKSILTFERFYYINILPLNKNEMFFDTKIKLTNIEVKGEIISDEKRLDLINYCIKILPLHLVSIINFKLIGLESIHIYFLFKTYILKEYLSIKFSQLKLFTIKEITTYIDQIFLSKSLLKINTYPTKNIHLAAGRLYWAQYIWNLEAKVKIKANLAVRNLKKMKRKFITKLIPKKSVDSLLRNKYINDKFLKFYKFYISAKKSLDYRTITLFYSLNKLMLEKVINFIKRFKKKRRIALKIFYKLLKRKKIKHYGKRWRKWRKKRRNKFSFKKLKRYTKFKLKKIFITSKKRKNISKKIKNFYKKPKNYNKKFPRMFKKPKIYKSIKFLIRKLSPKKKKNYHRRICDSKIYTH